MEPGLFLRLALVGFGGLIGAILRFGVGEAVAHTMNIRFPLGTLLVNAAGCLAIGFLFTFTLERGMLTPYLRLFVFAGILGGFTTFSAFGHETFLLWRDGMSARAAFYVVVSVTVGFGAVFLGHVIARLIPRNV